MTPPPPAIALALLRLAPVALSSASLTFAWATHLFIRGFGPDSIPRRGGGDPSTAAIAAAGMAAMPYWMKHVRDSSLWIIFATYVPNTLLGLANAYGYGSLLGGGRGAGSSAPGYYSSWAYLLGGIFSLAHFPLTFRMRMVALNLQLANDREPTAKREVAIKEFLRTNLLRSLGSSLTSVVSFLVAATLWAAEGVQ